MWAVSMKSGSGNIDLDGNIVSYFKSLSQLADRLNVWIPLPKGSPLIRSEDFNINFYRTNRFFVIFSGLRLLFHSRGSHIFLFMPAASRIAIFVPLYKFFSKSLTVYLADDPYALADGLRLSKVPFVKSLYLLLIKQYLKLADRVIVRGKYLRGLASRHNENVEITVPITKLIDYKNRKLLGGQNSRFNIVTLGRLTWEKGYKILLDAYSEWLHKTDVCSNQYKLTIGGDGPDAEAIKKYVKELNLENSVAFPGWILSEESKMQFWQDADLHVLPTINTEGVPRSIDEAIINQVPTIASAIGGIPEEYANNEICQIKPNNTKALLKAFEKMVDFRNYNQYLENAKIRREYLLKLPSAAEQHFSIIQIHLS